MVNISAVVMMQGVILLFIVSGVGIVATVDASVKSSTILITDVIHSAIHDSKEARVSRQTDCTVEQMQKILGNYPEDCLSGLEAINITQLQVLDQTQVAEFGAIFCQPRCGNPLVKFYQTCFGELGKPISTFFIQLCAKSPQGVDCYSVNAISTIKVAATNCSTIGETNATACASSCQSSLQSTVTSIDCCINLLNVGGLINTTGILQEYCSVEVPGFCTKSTLSGALALTMGIFTGVLAVLLAIILY